MKPLIRRLTRLTLLLALPATLGACAVVPAERVYGPPYGPVYGPAYGPAHGPAYGAGVYVAPPPVVIRPAPVYRGYYGGHPGRGWGHGHRW